MGGNVILIFGIVWSFEYNYCHQTFSHTVDLCYVAIKKILCLFNYDIRYSKTLIVFMFLNPSTNLT